MSVWHVGRAPPKGQSPDQVALTMAVRNAGLQFLVAADVRGIADGADITTWPARIGADPTQASAPLRPSYDADGPFVNFDTVGEALPTPAVDLTSATGATIIVACYQHDPLGSGNIWEHGPLFYNSNGLVLSFSVGKLYSGIGTPHSQRLAALSPRKVHVFGVSFDRVPADDDVHVHDQDGQVDDFTGVIEADSTGNFGGNSSWLGSRNNGASQPLGGGVSVMVALPVALDHRSLQALIEAVAQIAGVR